MLLKQLNSRITQVTIIFQSPVKQEPTSHLENLNVFHVKGTVSVLLELLPAQPVILEQLLIVTRLSVVGLTDFLFVLA